MSSALLQMDQPVRALEISAYLEKSRILAAVARGLDVATAQTASDIQEKRLTGQGPFPVDEGKLGVRSGRLRQSVRSIKAVITADTVVEAGIGSNVGYAGIHEFGGVINRTTQAGVVRLRTDRKGNLLKRGNLATFARRSHKGVREVSFEGGNEYQIRIPARAPFGSGIADNEDLFVREIEKALFAEMEGGSNP